MAVKSTNRKGSAKKGGASSKGAAAKKATTKKSAGKAAAKTGAKNTSPRGGKSTDDVYQDRTNPMLFYEIFLWLMLAFSVFLFISFFGIGGFVGEAVSVFFFGCFGVLAYLLPFVLFFITAFLISNRKSHIAKIKAASAGGLYLVACGIMELLLLGYTQGHDLMEYYEAGAQYHTGGGLVGGAFVTFFCPAIGMVGAYTVLLLMAIICLVLITQRSLFAGVHKKSSTMYQNAREEKARRREAARMRREYEHRSPELFDLSEDSEGKGKKEEKRQDSFTVLPKEPRMKRRITGVTTDTSMSGLSQLPSDEVHQVLPPRGDLELEPLEKAPQKAPEEETLPVPDEPIPIFRGGSPQPELMEEIPFEEIPVDSGKGEPEKKADVSRSALNPPEAPKGGAQDQTGAEKSRTARKSRSSQEEIQEGIADVAQEIEKNTAASKPEYVFPSTNLLKRPTGRQGGSTDAQLRETAQKLQQILQTFGVNVKVTNVSCGPSVTRYELMPEMGVKVSKIVNLADDIKLNLAAADIRIEAPIPGKAAVGIEVPNKESGSVLLRELLESEEFKKHPSNLAYAVGKDIGGKIIVSDIAKMPHLLIAGATGSGKSVFINTLIMSIIYKAKPEDVKMVMIDPKVVELSVYNGIPHLFIPVVTDPKKAAGALNWGVAEMMKRYELFAAVGVRDLKGYNARVEKVLETTPQEEGEERPQKLPQIVIIVDELADLMMVASGEVEDAICRLAQLARAAGIHLVIATQRPSVDVITGLIKANMPSRIAFSVSSGVDSRTILDMNGAEKLLGNGDMLFAPQTYKKPARIQGAFVSDKEVADVVEFLKEKNTDEQYDARMEEQIAQVQKSAASQAGGGSDVDELFADAGKFIIEKDKASIGMLQRWFKIGFNRAARIMDQLSEAGVVGPEEGTKPRKVLMSMEQFENYLEEN